MKRIYLILTILVQAAWVEGQSLTSAQLTWTSSGMYNKTNQETVAYGCTFETGPGVVKWIQKGGAVVYEFTVTGARGSWQNVAEDGELTLDVTFRGQPGTIRFARSGSSITIEPDIQKDGQNSMPFRFTISAINSR
ncbi:MAG: hypothetical protein JNN04_09510 [Cyclobacteriaceae bacterium]|nr:hypothetical protein [Cyclobacteriaceae bacterium]